MILNRSTYFAFIFLFLLIGKTLADNGNADKDEIRIGIIPFGNYTGTDEARKIMLPIIENSLKKQYTNILTSSEIRNTLRSYRIRAAGFISFEDAQILKENLGITHLLLGSLDFFDTTNIEVGVSARIVEIDSLKIIWASSASATGLDSESLLGLGRIDKIEKLIKKAADECFSKLNENLFGNNTKKQNNKYKAKWALVPFDNFSSYRNAGPVVDNVLLTELHNQGIEILEPGVVLDIFRRYNRLPRGQVDLQVINDLQTINDVDLIVTGAVEKFQQRSSRSPGSTPIFEFDARIINARTGTVLTTEALSGLGNDYETIFKMGTVNSLGDLIKKMSWKLIVKLNQKIKKSYFAKR